MTTKIELEKFRNPDLKWITSMLNIGRIVTNEDDKVTNAEVQINDLERLADRFGMTLELLNTGQAVFRCRICKRTFLHKPSTPFEFCSKEMHDEFYDKFGEDNPDSFIDLMNDEEKEERKALIKGYIPQKKEQDYDK